MKLHDQGLGAIEVTDDGHGVPKSSRPHMAARHATSKLRRFDDLYDDDYYGGGRRKEGRRVVRNDDGGGGGGGEDDCAPTLGFRGEALFCLANLSRSLVVSTRTVDENDDDDGDDDGDGDDENGGGGGDVDADVDVDGGRRRRGGSSSQSPSTTLGEQFRFDRDGHLVPGSVARVPLSYRSGTTVTVRGLFESLPVRRADMKKRIKAQKMKLIKMMQGCE